MKSLILVLCVLVPLSACQNGGAVGSGPLTLSPKAQAALRDYMKNTKPMVFVVSTDGRAYSYRYCPEAYDGCMRSSDTFRALENCREYSRGVPCKVYAKGHSIVWEGASD